MDKASYFIWELDLDLPSEVEPGRYEFLYKASSKNCVRLVDDQIKRGFEHQALTGDAHNLAMGIMNWAALVCADADTRYQRAELIDVVTYVRGRKNTGCDSRLVSNTLDRAGRSREWLLYPTTPMEDGLGFSARFAMNQHLRVYRCYRIRNKPAAT